MAPWHLRIEDVGCSAPFKGVVDLQNTEETLIDVHERMESLPKLRLGCS